MSVISGYHEIFWQFLLITLLSLVYCFTAAVFVDQVTNTNSLVICIALIKFY